MKNKFRPLTAEEIQFVSGGSNHIIVTGGGGGYGGGYGGGIWGGGGGGYETTPEPDYGGWEPDPHPEPCPSLEPGHAEKEQQVDDAAIQAGINIASALGALPGVVNLAETREFGAIIFEDSNGNIQTFGPVELPQTTNQYGETVYSTDNLTQGFLAAGHTGDSIRGVLHNHPAGTYPDVNLNRYPSNTDWTSSAFTSIGANLDNLSIYIMDARGVVRQFEFEDEAKYFNMSIEDKQNGVDLPEGTEAGNSCG